MERSDKRRKGAHPNSQDLYPAVNCPVFHLNLKSKRRSYFSICIRRPPCKAIRRYISQRTGNHGVFVGSIMSETTAAATGQVGVIRRDPIWQCSHSAATIRAIIEALGLKSVNPRWRCYPRFSMLTGFRVKMTKVTSYGLVWWITRVLWLIIDRCEARLTLRSYAIGYLPYAKDINLEGLDMTEADLEKILLMLISMLKEELICWRTFYAVWR